MKVEKQIYPKKNPIREIVSDDTYKSLVEANLLNKNKIRDFTIKKRYAFLRSTKMNADDCIVCLQKEYPYLQIDTLKKLSYQKKIGNKK